MTKFMALVGIVLWGFSLVYGTNDAPEIMLRSLSNILGVLIAAMAIGLELQRRDKG